MSEERDERIERFGQIPPELDEQDRPPLEEEARTELIPASILRAQMQHRTRQIQAAYTLAEAMKETAKSLLRLYPVPRDIEHARSRVQEIKQKVEETCRLLQDVK